jgi:hypothetical protein
VTANAVRVPETERSFGAMLKARYSGVKGGTAAACLGRIPISIGVRVAVARHFLCEWIEI